MKIFVNINGQTSIYPSLPKRREFWIRRLCESHPKSEFLGTCRVSYSSTYYNEFDFNGYDDFRNKVLPCLEEELLKDFIEKRKK